MGPNRLVAHYKDGHVLKGHSIDFVPGKKSFHLTSMGIPEMVEEIRLEDLKAVFFVKDFTGDPSREERRVFDPHVRYIGKRLFVKFQDGELFAGIRQAFNPDHKGFFLTPVDTESNILRVFVVMSAVDSITEA